MLRERALVNSSIIVALTESHLKAEILDAEIHMEGFQIFRADRTQGKKKGGVIVYLKNEVANNANVLTAGSNGTVEWMVLHLRKLNIVFITMYRPPSCETDKFKSILQIISNEIEKLGTPSPTVIICGDCNFPIIDWNKMVPFGGSSAARVQAEAFLEFNNEHFLQQYVQEPTRVKNILDLFLTNNPDVITEISVCDTLMSDHKVIIVGTNISLDHESKMDTPSLSGVAALNFHHSSINWDDIESDLMNLNWSTIFEGKNTEEMVIRVQPKGSENLRRQYTTKEKI